MLGSLDTVRRRTKLALRARRVYVFVWHQRQERQAGSYPAAMADEARDAQTAVALLKNGLLRGDMTHVHMGEQLRDATDPVVRSSLSNVSIAHRDSGGRGCL